MRIRLLSFCVLLFTFSNMLYAPIKEAEFNTLRRQIEAKLKENIDGYTYEKANAWKEYITDRIKLIRDTSPNSAIVFENQMTKKFGDYLKLLTTKKPVTITPPGPEETVPVLEEPLIPERFYPEVPLVELALEVATAKDTIELINLEFKEAKNLIASVSGKEKDEINNQLASLNEAFVKLQGSQKTIEQQTANIQEQKKKLTAEEEKIATSWAQLKEEEEQRELKKPFEALDKEMAQLVQRTKEQIQKGKESKKALNNLQEQTAAVITDIAQKTQKDTKKFDSAIIQQKADAMLREVRAISNAINDFIDKGELYAAIHNAFTLLDSYYVQEIAKLRMGQIQQKTQKEFDDIIASWKTKLANYKTAEEKTFNKIKNIFEEKAKAINSAIEKKDSVKSIIKQFDELAGEMNKNINPLSVSRKRYLDESYMPRYQQLKQKIDEYIFKLADDMITRGSIIPLGDVQLMTQQFNVLLRKIDEIAAPLSSKRKKEFMEKLGPQLNELKKAIESAIAATKDETVQAKDAIKTTDEFLNNLETLMKQGALAQNIKIRFEEVKNNLTQIINALPNGNIKQKTEKTIADKIKNFQEKLTKYEIAAFMQEIDKITENMKKGIAAPTIIRQFKLLLAGTDERTKLSLSAEIKSFDKTIQEYAVQDLAKKITQLKNLIEKTHTYSQLEQKEFEIYNLAQHIKDLETMLPSSMIKPYQTDFQKISDILHLKTSIVKTIEKLQKFQKLSTLEDFEKNEQQITVLYTKISTQIAQLEQLDQKIAQKYSNDFEEIKAAIFNKIENLEKEKK